MLSCGFSFVFTLLFATALAGTKEEELHPCHSNGTCTCTSLRDSDCYCTDRAALQPENSTCDCSIITEECWETRTYSDYNLTDGCSQGEPAPVSATLYTTSMSTEGVHVMRLLKEVMEVADKLMDFKIVFLLDHVGWPDITTITDSPEIRRNELILCARNIDPRASVFFPYLYCLGLNQNADIRSEHVRDCATEHGYSSDELEMCVREDGLDLLAKDLIRSIKDVPNPTLVLDHEAYTLNETDTVETVLKKLCEVLANPSDDYSFPYWIFTLLSCSAICVVLVLWVIRKPSTQAAESLMQLFFESAFVIDEDPAEIALRRWHGENVRAQGGTANPMGVLSRLADISEESESVAFEDDSD